MAVTSAQESIMADLITTLQNINGAGNYNLNLSTRTYREWIDPNTMAKENFPYACVLDEEDWSFVPLTAKEYTTGRTQLGVTDGWPVAVIVYVKVDRDLGHEGLLSKELIKAYSDVTIAVLADHTRGGYAVSTVLASISKRGDYAKLKGGMKAVFIIKYDFNPTASSPTT